MDEPFLSPKRLINAVRFHIWFVIHTEHKPKYTLWQTIRRYRRPEWSHMHKTGKTEAL